MINNPFPDSIKKIAIIAPAGPPDKSKFNAGLTTLESLGIEIFTMANVFNQCSTPYLSASVDDRVADLHCAWEDQSIDLILCARGGYGSAQLIEKIDWNLLRSRDIPFLGYSDITALHLAMIQQGVKTPISAPMCCNITEATTHPLTRKSLGQSLSNVTGKLKTSSISGHTQLTSPVIAANLTILTSMIGTPFFPDLAETTLLLEDIAEDIYKIDRHLTQLHLSGVLENVAAVIFGDFKDCGNKNNLDELFKRFSDQNSFPTFSNCLFGHISSTHCIQQKQTYSIVT